MMNRRQWLPAAFATLYCLTTLGAGANPASDGAIAAAVAHAVRFEATDEVVFSALARLQQEPPGAGSAARLGERVGTHSLSLFLLAARPNDAGGYALAAAAPGPTVAKAAAERMSRRLALVDEESVTHLVWRQAGPSEVVGSFDFDGVYATGTCRFRAVPVDGLWVVGKLVIARRGSEKLDDGLLVFQRTDAELPAAARTQRDLASARAEIRRQRDKDAPRLAGKWFLVSATSGNADLPLKDRIWLEFAADGQSATMSIADREGGKAKSTPCKLVNGRIDFGGDLAFYRLVEDRLVVEPAGQKLIFGRTPVPAGQRPTGAAPARTP